jgi:hypothetical protein
MDLSGPAPAEHLEVAAPGDGPRGGARRASRNHPDILNAAGGTRLIEHDAQHWAGPLDELRTRVLARDIGQHLPGSLVLGEHGVSGHDLDAVASAASALPEVSGKVGWRRAWRHPTAARTHWFGR